MAFIPHTEADVAAMLAAIGVARIEDLFDEVPAELRVKSLSGVPAALNEMEIGRLMSERARRDGIALNFLGAGAYEHHIPAAVWAITTRGEFYSAYTPYQAEASQGTLQLIYEFQSMLVVTEVLPGSPSEKVLQPGDILLRLNGRYLTQFEPLEDVLDSSVGSDVELELERGGKLVSAKLPVGDLHDCANARPQHRVRHRLGVGKTQLSATAGFPSGPRRAARGP